MARPSISPDQILFQPRALDSERLVTVGLVTLAACAAIILCVYFKDIVGQQAAPAIYAVATVVTLWFSIVYIANLHFRKLHRYSRAIPYFHFINHRVRDTLGTISNQLSGGRIAPNNERLFVAEQVNAILTAAAAAFSAVTGHNCAVCIKELRIKDGSEVLWTIARDLFSSGWRKRRDDARNEAGQLIKNSPSARTIISDGHSFFLDNNLPRSWKKGKYRPPGASREAWKRPYRSTLVVPIRFKQGCGTEERGFEVPPLPTAYWGFFCVDSSARNCFKKRIDPHMAMLIGDVLYVLFSQLELLSRLEPLSPTH